MKDRTGPGGTLICDVCDKPSQSLGSYNMPSEWAACLRCFARADEMAFKEDRWPTDDYFARLREKALRAATVR